MESPNFQKQYGIVIASVVYDFHAPKNRVTGRIHGNVFLSLDNPRSYVGLLSADRYRRVVAIDGRNKLRNLIQI